MNFSRYRSHMVLGIDLCLVFVINFLLFLPAVLRDDIRLLNLLGHIGLLLVCFVIAQTVFKTYESLWRYAETREYFLLLLGMGCGFIIYALVNLVLGTTQIWITRAATGTVASLLAMLLFRFSYRAYRQNIIHSPSQEQGARSIAIIGAGNAGVSLAVSLTRAKEARYKPYCFIDDDVQKRNKRIRGIKVYGPIDDVEEILKGTPVTEIVLVIQHLSSQRRMEILKQCSKTNCRVHVLEDSFSKFNADKRPDAANMRAIQIEDLLGREPVRLEHPRVSEFVSGKTVLVTGGGGSIGSELCRQIAKNKPKQLVILDIAENTTYELQQELEYLYGAGLSMHVEIASVRDAGKMELIFEKYRPELVFHAAAHKHVPLMEDCPEEAIKNNVFGTYNVASAARKFGAEKFVLISTDKAVNPTNVMGTTKFLCEQVIQAFQSETGTVYAAVRFGNVLGSNGSVIPLFQRQIERGGPVTITDKRIIRYFMTISEAVQLVLEAGYYAKRGEVYVLDMGDPVHILDLAENMIRLSGHQPYSDIPIEEVGLRPGEKLYEELLTAGTELEKTANEKIFVEKKMPLDVARMRQQLDALQKAAETGDRDTIIDTLHEMVPTFREPAIVNAEAIERAKVR